MAHEDERPERKAAGDESENERDRFPEVPVLPEVPEAPKLARVDRPKRPTPGPANLEPGSYNKAALASVAASSFIMPVILLTLLGYWLDEKMHHTTYYLALIGVLVGLVVGVSSLMRIINKLSQ